MEYINLNIGIQARSTSERFPGKVFAQIDDHTLLEKVIDACEKSAFYINRHNHKSRVMVNVSLLIPKGDPILKAIKKRVLIIEGDEHDVLSRYMTLMHKTNSDYIVRITGDCPMIPPPLITKAIKTTLMNHYDYFSNVDEDLRISLDGDDVEVISSKALTWLGENAKDPKDREHVTTLIRREPPEWAKMGHLFGYYDFSNTPKRSVDTEEDLERVRAISAEIDKKIKKCEKKYGKGSAHRF